MKAPVLLLDKNTVNSVSRSSKKFKLRGYDNMTGGFVDFQKYNKKNGSYLVSIPTKKGWNKRFVHPNEMLTLKEYIGVMKGGYSNAYDNIPNMKKRFKKVSDKTLLKKGAQLGGGTLTPSEYTVDNITPESISTDQDNNDNNDLSTTVAVADGSDVANPADVSEITDVANVEGVNDGFSPYSTGDYVLYENGSGTDVDYTFTAKNEFLLPQAGDVNSSNFGSHTSVIVDTPKISLDDNIVSSADLYKNNMGSFFSTQAGGGSKRRIVNVNDPIIGMYTKLLSSNDSRVKPSTKIPYALGRDIYSRYGGNGNYNIKNKNSEIAITHLGIEKFGDLDSYKRTFNKNLKNLRKGKVNLKKMKDIDVPLGLMIGGGCMVAGTYNSTNELPIVEPEFSIQNQNGGGYPIPVLSDPVFGSLLKIFGFASISPTITIPLSLLVFIYEKYLKNRYGNGKKGKIIDNDMIDLGLKAKGLLSSSYATLVPMGLIAAAKHVNKKLGKK